MRETIVQGLFSSDVIVAVGDPKDDPAPLWPAEEAMITRAVEKRRREFAKGRECARQALAALGVTNFPLVAGDNREPIWPPGIVGSLTHTANLCVVAVGRASAYAAIGIDAEPAEALTDALEERICTLDELTWLGTFPDAERAIMARVVFSAKECFYKCQHTLSQTYMGFQDATTRFGDETFAVTFLKDVAPFRKGSVLEGRWARRDGFVLTSMTIPASSGYTRRS